MQRPRTLALLAAFLSGFLPAQETKPRDKPPERPRRQSEYEKVATLGVETRAPTKEECARYALDLNVRYQGQMIERVARDGVGARAGLRQGDVLLVFDKVEIFSRDDIRDLLMVRKPGQKVTLQVLRYKDAKRTDADRTDAERTKEKVVVRLELGERKVPRRMEPCLRWHYAGLAYLEDALAQAKKEGKRVLVGLSGADT